MKTKGFLLGLAVCILAFCLGIASCDDGSSAGSGGTHSVRYLITGPQTTANNVFWRNETGNYDTINNVPIPWEKTITIHGSTAVGCGATLLTANGSSNGFTYTGKIYVDGSEISTASSSSGSLSVTGFIQ